MLPSTKILLRLLDLMGTNTSAANAGYVYCYLEQAVSVITKGLMWDEITNMEIKRTNLLTKCTVPVNPPSKHALG